MSEGGTKRLAGYMVEFDAPEPLIEAARAVRDAGYTRYDAFTPYPIGELNEIVAGHHSKLPLIVFLGGLAGAICGFALQYWSSVIAYPMNVGGKPLNSWPAFIVPTFETTILFAGFSAVLGMLALNGLPRPHHPVFSAERFALASRDRYFLYIESRDPNFDREATRRMMQALPGASLMEVELD